MRIAKHMILALCLVGVAGIGGACVETGEPDGGESDAVEGDVGTVEQAAGLGKPCGDNFCGAGEFCCNASCGICAPLDGACIQIACEPVNGSPSCLGFTKDDSCMNGKAFGECMSALAQCGGDGSKVAVLESCPLQFRCF